MHFVFSFKKRRVLAMGDYTHACCLSLGRWREPPYLAAMCLVNNADLPWVVECLDKLLSYAYNIIA